MPATMTAPLHKITLLAMYVVPSLAIACSPSADWKPHTPNTAFRSADVVIHARVLSQESPPGTIHERRDGRRVTVTAIGAVRAKIEVLSVLKGTFTHDFVTTGLDSYCGVGKFVDGAEYVFFLSKGNTFISYLTQPWNVTTAQTLDAIRLLQE
jgi:hypothetical protein